MKNIIIENTPDLMILKINKKAFDQDYLISLIKRLETEQMIEKADFKEEILEIADQIDQSWWDENGETFLKDVTK